MPSSNVSLGDITIKDLDENLYTKTIVDDTHFELTVEYEVEELNIQVTPQDPTATITNDSDIGIQELEVGINEYKITAIAQDNSTTEEYYITITRKANTKLAELIINKGDLTLNPVFDNSKLTYEVVEVVPNLTHFVTVDAKAEDSDVTITITGYTAELGPLSKEVNLEADYTIITNITIRVTGADGTTKDYVVAVTKAKPIDNNANLKTLVITNTSGTASIPAITITPSVTEYKVQIPTGVSEVNILGTPESMVATITSGNGKKTIPQTSAIIEVTIEVTAESGTTKIYTVNLFVGVSVNSCLIKTPEDLNNIRNPGTYCPNRLWVIANDIDLTNSSYKQWTTIPGVTGTIDGLGHTINGLNISSTGQKIGFISTLTSGTLKNLTFTNVKISGSSYIGSVVYSAVASTIENVHVQGSVTGVSYIGGVIGQISSTVIIRNVSMEGSVYGTGPYVSGIVGNLLGTNHVIENSYNKASVTGLSYVGGIVADLYSPTIKLINVYNLGAVLASTLNAGGIVGSGRSGSLYENVYNAGKVSNVTGSGPIVGNLVGTPTLKNVYYIAEKTGFTGTVNAGTKMLEADCKNASSYNGFDFTKTWDIDLTINDGLPYLRDNN